MKVSDIDYYSIYGNSFLHKIKASYKIIITVAIICFSLISENLFHLSVLLVFLYIFLLSLKLNKIKLILITLYPIIFLFFYFVSIDNITLHYIAITTSKALNCSTCAFLLTLTTPYISILKFSSKILPAFFLNFMFLTYRSFFILLSIVEELSTSLRIRGQLKFSKPVYSIKILSKLVGLLIIKSIEKSEAMYNCMRIRGYNNELKYLQD